MSLKLITYTKSFYPYLFQLKIRSIIGVYMVLRDGKLLKRSFAEMVGYNDEELAESDALANGLAWISKNIPDIERERLDVALCGNGRTDMKKKLENGGENIHRRSEIMKIIIQFDEVHYAAQGKIIDDDPMYDLFGFANKVFELFYGRDNGYMHHVYEEEEIGGKIKVTMIGEPEIHHKNRKPDWVWS